MNTNIPVVSAQFLRINTEMESLLSRMRVALIELAQTSDTDIASAVEWAKMVCDGERKICIEELAARDYRHFATLKELGFVVKKDEDWVISDFIALIFRRSWSDIEQALCDSCKKRAA